MNRKKLIEEIKKKKSFLCVGLDPDVDKMPKKFLDEEDPIFEFNMAIIDATADYCVAYKPNAAFYEAYGLTGMESLEKTIRYIKANYPDHFVIADAKRGDIGNTAERYAKAFFYRLNADAITVAPYMGSDSVKPFLGFENKWAIVLGLTSNEGAADFQLKAVDHEPLFMNVIRKCAGWGTPENMMFVVGATKAEMMGPIRELVPDHFFLVPGVGTQGGSLEEVCKYGLNKDIGLLVNASRNIIYASNGDDFAEKAAAEAKKLSSQMSMYVK